MPRPYIRRTGIVAPLTATPAPRTIKAHCKRGHAFTAANTRWTKSGRRRCIACEHLRHCGALHTHTRSQP